MKDPWLAWPRELRRAGVALLRLALEEDLGTGDLTARYFATPSQRLTVRLVAREAGVLAGLPLFFKTFQAAGARASGRAPHPGEGLRADGNLEIIALRDDGSAFAAGEELALFSAPAPIVHTGERTALNFLQRLSGVATGTARAVAASAGPAVLDTRKTTPGFRMLEKYAVRMGGGRNHRMGLHDAIMVKDNHKESLGGMAAVMDRVESLPADAPLIVEVDDLEELAILLAHPGASRVQRVLLDNFAPEEVQRALALRDARGGGPDYEISGGLRPEDLADTRFAGVEAASLGGLTHSAPALDLAIEVLP